MQENSCRYQNQVLVELTLLCLWVLLPSVFFVVFVSRGDPEIRANSASFYAWCGGGGYAEVCSSLEQPNKLVG